MDNHEEQYNCDECNNTVKGYHRFCHHCGAYLGVDAEQISIFNNQNLRAAFFFYVIYLFICLMVSYTDWFHTYDTLFWIEILLAVITAWFAKANWAQIKPALKFNNFSWPLLFTVIAGALVFSSVVNVSINQINISVFRKSTSLYEAYRIYHLPVLIMFYSIALMPALFEELAFRGVLYNYFSRFLDERLVVMVTGCIFAAIHLNFFALVWLIPFGILIGSLRRKYNTIWYGVVFHFSFNVTACLFDLYRQGEFW